MTLLLTIEILILVVLGARVLSILLKPPFRRDLRTMSRELAGGLVVVTLGGAVTGAWLLARSPMLPHATVVVALGVSLFLWLRARPSWGTRRGLPPGSLGISASIDAIYDRDYYRRQVALHGPVFKMSQFGRPVVCVWGLKRARAVLADAGESLTGASLPYNRAVGRGALRYMKPETHQQERPLFRQALGAFELESTEEAVRAACRSQLQRVVEAGLGSGDGVAIRQHLDRFVLESTGRIFFGLASSDPRIDAFEALLPSLEFTSFKQRDWRARMERGMTEATSLIREIEPVEGTALGILRSLDPNAIEDPTRARNLIVAFRLANGDVTALLDWVFEQLSRHPEWQRRVIESSRTTGEPAGSQPRDIGSRVVLETLRHEQSEFLYRRVVSPISIEGFTIPAGWLLRILVHESHRDPAVFDAPDVFDPDRFLHRAFDRTEFSPFGADVHGCMGARLTLFLGRVFVEELCHGFSWSVPVNGPLERGTRHRHHWRPSSRRRVAMARREAPRAEAMPDRAHPLPA